MPTITAFERSPDQGTGLARDMPIRWAFEEVGQRYDTRLLSFAQMKQPAHLALQPFGQIPTLEDGELRMFESGAIILHIAQTYPGLLPQDPADRARALSWIFAALSTVEPPIVERDEVTHHEAGKSWQSERFEIVDARIRKRLAQLVAGFGDADRLAGNFSAADILMVHTLRRLEGSGLLEQFPPLIDYIDRATARPAYRRAFAAQLAVFMSAPQAD